MAQRRRRQNEEAAILRVGRICNNHCVYCIGTRGATTLEEALAEAPPTPTGRLRITGREPTLLPWLADLVRALRQRGWPEIELETNGRIFAYATYARALARAGLTRARVKIFEEAASPWDEHTRTRGSFEQTWLGVDHLRRAGVAVQGLVVTSPQVEGRESELNRAALERGLPGARTHHHKSLVHFSQEGGDTASDANAAPADWTVEQRLAGPDGDGDAAAEVVLVSPPIPHGADFFPASLVFLSGALEERGISHRLLAFAGTSALGAPFAELGVRAYYLDEPLAVRFAAMDDLARGHQGVIDRHVDRILAGPEGLVGFSVFRSNVDLALLLAREVRRRAPERQIVFGGPEMDWDTVEYARFPFVDAVVVGDGESLLPLLVEAARQRQPLDQLTEPGLVTAASRGAITRAMAIPGSGGVLSYRAMEPYLRSQQVVSVPVRFARGCPYRCAFCNNRELLGTGHSGAQARFLRQLDVVEQQLDAAGALANRRQRVVLSFLDCACNSDLPRLDALLGPMAARATILPCEGQFFADHRLDRQRIRRLRAAGFGYLSFGIESGSERVRRAMRKPGKVSEMQRIIDDCQREGTREFNLQIIVGWPDETEAEFRQTLSFLDGLAGLPFTVSVNTLMVFRNVGLAGWPGLSQPGRSGVAWRTDAPAGDPAVRARRYLTLLDRYPGGSVVGNLPRPYVEQWMGPS